MANPLFIATERFDPSDGQGWQKYCEWAKIPGLTEIVSLDGSLCEHLFKGISDEDWDHIVIEDYRSDYFYHLDYLLHKAQDIPHRNILGLYRNPEAHITSAPAQGSFIFVGYDLIDEQTQISALTNCGGFPNSFRNDELNCFGLIESFERAHNVRLALAENNPNDPHAQCEMYAIWRLNETQ